MQTEHVIKALGSSNTCVDIAWEGHIDDEDPPSQYGERTRLARTVAAGVEAIVEALLAIRETIQTYS